MAVNNGIPGPDNLRSKDGIVYTIQKHRQISRASLVEITGFSKKQVCRIVDQLFDEGKVVESTPIPADRGRPTALLSINPRSSYAAGLRLGPETVEIALSDACGAFLDRQTIYYGHDTRAAEDVLDQIARRIAKSAESAGISRREMKGIGVSVAGLADSSSGVMESITHRKGWENLNVSELLEQPTGLPVYVDNDVRAGALAAEWFGDSDSGRDALYVYVGDGVGAAFIQGDTKLLRGAHDAACLMGHVTVDPDGPECGCGNNGCLDMMGSDTAFIQRLRPAVPTHASDITVADRVRLVRHGLEMASRGNTHAIQALETTLDYLSIGFANLVSVLDPHCVLVSGTMMEIDNTIMDRLRSKIIKRIWPRVRNLEMRRIENWQDFLLRGAVGMVFWQP